MGIEDQVLNLKRLITTVEEDASKVDNGNKSAGVRLRRSLKEAMNQIKKIRSDVLETRKKE
jgi:hypothetical protein